MNSSRLITGGIMMMVGIVLVILPVFFAEKLTFLTWIYGIPILIIGLFILFNRNEDKIESIKYRERK
ncbi:MAG: hypothetical protein ABH804_02605 [archaeon]